MANNDNPHSPGNVTFVQADPSTFRTIVQRLTGAPASKLHERRQNNNNKKLEKIQLVNGTTSGSYYNYMLGSPVSPFDMLTRGSPRTPPVLSPVEEEEKAILEKRFYLHPTSPTNVTRRDLELLPLFPVCSPGGRDIVITSNSNSCS